MNLSLQKKNLLARRFLIWIIFSFPWILDPCGVPLGLEDKRIPNGQFSASSYYNHHLAPWHGRRNHRWSWSVRYRNNKQWLQVNMVEIYRVRGIGTQGRQDANQWVKTYTVSYGMNGVDFTQYKENRRVKVTDDQFFYFILALREWERVTLIVGLFQILVMIYF